MTGTGKLFFLALLLPSSVQAADTHTTCHSPLGVPCHVLHYEWSQWVFFEHGITDIRHLGGKIVTAVRSDGSTYSETLSENTGRFFETKGSAYDVTGFYLAPVDKVVKVFPDRQSYSSREPLIWHDRPFRRSEEGDATCGSGILHRGTDFHLDPKTTTLLGMRIVHWSRTLQNGGSEDVYMAPDLDCTALKTVRAYRSKMHLPRMIISQEATRIEWGEPSGTLFTVPAAYQLVEDPALPGLQRYLNAQKR